MTSHCYQKLRKSGLKDMHNMELIKKCKQDNELLGEFLKENRDFIFSIIKHFKGSIEEIRMKFRVTDDELYQHACIGFLTALQDFDCNRGIKFTTFVVRPILWEINHLLYSDSQSVRLSRGAVELLKKMGEIEHTLGHRPNEETMAKLLEISVERYREIATFSDDLEHYDGIANFDIAETSELNLEQKVTDRVYVQQLLNDPIFTEFEKTVMILIMKEASYSQIADQLGVYPMTINRTLTRIRTKIQQQESNAPASQSKATSKYDREIHAISHKIKENTSIPSVEKVIALLNEQGFDCSLYSIRVLYYIRQKAIQESSK